MLRRWYFHVDYFDDECLDVDFFVSTLRILSILSRWLLSRWHVNCNTVILCQRYNTAVMLMGACSIPRWCVNSITINAVILIDGFDRMMMHHKRHKGHHRLRFPLGCSIMNSTVLTIIVWKNLDIVFHNGPHDLLLVETSISFSTIIRMILICSIFPYRRLSQRWDGLHTFSESCIYWSYSCCQMIITRSSSVSLTSAYAQYDVEVEHMVFVGKSLIWSLKQGLGHDFTGGMFSIYRLCWAYHDWCLIFLELLVQLLLSRLCTIEQQYMYRKRHLRNRRLCTIEQQDLLHLYVSCYAMLAISFCLCRDSGTSCRVGGRLEASTLPLPGFYFTVQKLKKFWGIVLLSQDFMLLCIVGISTAISIFSISRDLTSSYRAGLRCGPRIFSLLESV